MQGWLGRVVIIGSVGLAGCAGSQGGGGEATGEASLALIDNDARAAGFALSTEEGRRPAIAPVTLEGEVALVGPGQRIPLEGAPGELLVVRGKTGALVPFTLGTEVETDRVSVEGTEDGAKALARALGNATVTGKGSGPFVLSAPDLLLRLAHMDMPRGVNGLSPIEIEGGAPSADIAVARTARLEVASRVGRDASEHMADFSAADPRFASFSLTGAHAPACADPAAGTWQSAPQYYPEYDDWYAFTLHVERSKENAGQVLGTVEARAWQGGPEKAQPPDCGDSPFHAQVSEPAAGVIDGSSIHFDSSSWSLAGNSCTSIPQGYNPDRFSGVLDGSVLRSVNNDGGRSVNDPVGFERTSCR